MFECGSWVHIREDLTNQFAGYDGEVIQTFGNRIAVRIHDVAIGDSIFELRLIPYVCEFEQDEIELLPPEEETTFTIFRSKIERWNEWINGN